MTEHEDADRPSAEPPTAGLPHISRRRFLTYATATGTFVYLGDFAAATRALAAPKQIVLGAPPFTRTARRREDFLALTFEFRNLKLDNSKPRNLVKVNKNQPATMTVVLPPQHLADEYFENGEDLPTPGDVRTRLARPTRLAFEVPDSLLPLAYDLEKLLDWSKLPLRVVPVAQPALLNPQDRAPNPDETSIELPWFLILSPLPAAGWFHATTPVTHGNRTELWHSRLGNRDSGAIIASGEVTYPLQAVWALDHPTNPTTLDAGMELPLDRNERIQLVIQTSDRGKGSSRRPVQARRMMLSSLGGWLDAHGEWPDETFDIAAWTQRTAMGRDTYVRVVSRGFLFPFGHKAAFIKVTERKFREVASGYKGAYLVKRGFVVVRQPVRDFGGTGHPDDGRAFPFRTVRLTTTSTPDIDLPPEGAPFFVPKLDGLPVLFDLIGTDWAGQETELSSPLTFVALAPGGVPESVLTKLVNEYNAANLPDMEPDRPTHGQKVAFAPEKKRGDTSFDVARLVLGAQKAVSGAVGQLEALGEAPFFPQMLQAGIRLPAAEQLAGQVLGEALVGLDPAFVQHAFDLLDDVLNPGNPGEVFLQILDDSLGTLSFGGSSDRSGGISTPDLSLSGLSRLLGPVGGALDNVRKGTFDPKDFFDDAAKLLGSLKLGDVIEKVLGPHGAKDGPKIQTVLEPEPPAVPQRAITKLEWEPKLRPDPAHIFLPHPGESGDPDAGSLRLDAAFVTELADPANSTFAVKGELRNFDLQLIGESKFIVITVEKLLFTSGKDKKPDIEVELGDVRFDGPLKFVEEFRNFLSSLGPGFAVDVTAKGIDASLTLPLPTVAVGVFSLQNISILLGAIVPFTGDAARFRFGFCSRENPFKLTVAMFGGGGFFAFECGTDKSIMLEVSLEFGASVAFDIGVASGGVEVMAGIYIKVENDDAMLSGFLRMGGELEILGIIRIACELYLGFEYYVEPDKCIGRARFFLEIEILIFSFTIEAEVERRFGGEDDPTFAQMMSPADWTEYCNAYAAIGAP